MNTTRHLRSYLAQFFLEEKYFRHYVWRKSKHTLCVQ